jgi:hypothetical protein
MRGFLLLDSSKWKLERGKTYDIALLAGSRSVQTKALAETKSVTITLADRALNERMHTANILEVRGEGATLRVPLDGSTAALGAWKHISRRIAALELRVTRSLRRTGSLKVGNGPRLMNSIGVLQAIGLSSLSANQTTSFFLVAGFGSGAYSAKLLSGTRQRFSSFSQPRQCGDEVLDVCDRRAPGPWRWRHASPPHDQLALGPCATHHRSRIVRKHAGHRRQPP